MNESLLEKVLNELFFRDALLRVKVPVHDMLSEQELPTIKNWLDLDKEGTVFIPTFGFEEAVQLASTPGVNYALARTAQYAANFVYRNDATAADGSFYVHVPPWVKVHRAPFHTFGPNLFGLAYTSTGDVHVRDDLEGDEFSEVLQHEVFHQLYPNCSEGQIRQFTLARFGERASIHRRIGPGQ